LGKRYVHGNGWLKEQDQQFFYNRIQVLEKHQTKCISFAGNYVENCQNMMYISCDQLRQCTKLFDRPSCSVYLERSLHSGVDVLVGTPGRIKDLLERGCLNPTQLSHVVLDEVDRMLDMGFADDVDAILTYRYSGDYVTESFALSAKWPLK